MKNSSLIALALALIGLSGCIAYPMDDHARGGENGAQRDRDPGRDRRDDHHDDGDRDHRPECDPRASDCPHH